MRRARLCGSSISSSVYGGVHRRCNFVLEHSERAPLWCGGLFAEPKSVDGKGVGRHIRSVCRLSVWGQLTFLAMCLACEGHGMLRWSRLTAGAESEAGRMTAQQSWRPVCRQKGKPFGKEDGDGPRRIFSDELFRRRFRYSTETSQSMECFAAAATVNRDGRRKRKGHEREKERER